MLTVYLIGAAFWWWAIVIMAGLAVTVDREPPTGGEIVATCLVAAVHGAFWPVSLPVTLVLTFLKK